MAAINLPQGRGTLRVVSPQQLQDAEKQARAIQEAKPEALDNLANHVRQEIRVRQAQGEPPRASTTS